MLNLPDEDRDPKASHEKAIHELAWFRITVVVASAGYCTGQLLLWLKH